MSKWVIGKYIRLSQADRDVMGREGKTVKVPKEEPIIVEGKHRGIVTKEEFLEAQRAFRKNNWKPKAQEDSYPLYGKVRCGTCGRAMNHRSDQMKGKEYRYYMCLHAAVQVEAGCCKRYTKEERVRCLTGFSCVWACMHWGVCGRI